MMVIGMPGGFKRDDLHSRDRDRFAVDQRDHPGNRCRDHSAPEGIKLTAVNSAGAFDKTGGINQMGGTFGMDVNGNPFPCKPSCRPRMIQMDMGDKNSQQVPGFKPRFSQGGNEVLAS